MPEEAIAHDPILTTMTGSIYRLPDIPVLVRGKTYVKLPSGRDIEVDPEFKRDEPVPAATHEHAQAGNALENLLKQLTGKRTEGDSKPAGCLTTTRKPPCCTPTKGPGVLPTTGRILPFRGTPFWCCRRKGGTPATLA